MQQRLSGLSQRIKEIYSARAGLVNIEIERQEVGLQHSQDVSGIRVHWPRGLRRGARQDAM